MRYKDILVTIIVPVYNVANKMEKCIQSLLGQDYSNIEIIFIDDGSKDGSGSILDKIHDSRVKVYHKDNSGVSSARNLGLEKMDKHGYVLFVDSDDYIDENYISKMLEASSDNRGCLIGCRFIKEDIFGKRIGEKEELIKYTDKYSAILSDKYCGGYVWNKVFDKNIILEHNLKFDTTISYAEDLLFVLEYLKYVENVVVIKDEIYHYVMYKDSVTNRGFDEQNIKSLLKALKIAYSMIPDKYATASQMAYNKLFNMKIYYWILMYKAGIYKKTDKVFKSTIVQMRKNGAEFDTVKHKVYYYCLQYASNILFKILCIDLKKK